MSLTPLPRSPRKVCLWRIFFALPFRNGPLPGELKFRENTENNKKDSNIDPCLHRRRITHENNHARNKRFQLPAFPTANQILWHCSNSQSALRSKSGRNEQKLVIVCLRPDFSGSRQRESGRIKVGR